MDTDLQRFSFTTSPERVNTRDKRTLSAIPWRGNHSSCCCFSATARCFWPFAFLDQAWSGGDLLDKRFMNPLPSRQQHATYSTIEYALKSAKNAGVVCTRYEPSSKKERERKRGRGRREKKREREILKKKSIPYVSRISHPCNIPIVV